MKKFNIEVISKKPKKVYDLLSPWGQITIGDYKEKFIMPLNSWAVKQYQQQWKKGIERIKTHDSSCLVATVQNLTTNPLIEMYTLYKENNTIFIRSQLLIKGIVDNLNIPIKLSEFNSKNCYQFINSRTIPKDDFKPDEWSISVADFLSSTCTKSRRN